ncbi:cupin domain-containing protein [Aureibacillus halotolerans]|uniref:Oxalate decarboxylase/phosphoglucose isomerase-like protein (Cupin superfamily) n=1 Tax=Aureibacillus halotolerans TaxID=1508390 RepID=A0A4R6U993_9BACI|nr:cupin domain-containing protein [Aureibacillus halotolerans]TDQ43011.1 oxalate decarboxylase/phosphoglucose isomerase-like protein (cupin superfamily) [Aureibacillus halotolerans]
MAVSYMDFTSPSTKFTYDLTKNTLFRKNNRNYIYALTSQQLNTLGNVSMLDVFLSKGNIIEPHIHQNASELVYVASGSVIVSIFNPYTLEFKHYPLSAQQAASVPQGWWHYITAREDGTHFLAIFDAPIPQVIYGSDILRFTPPEALARTYCLNQQTVKKAFEPLKDTVVIGPPADCQQPRVQNSPVYRQQVPLHSYPPEQYFQSPS